MGRSSGSRGSELGHLQPFPSRLSTSLRHLAQCLLPHSPFLPHLSTTTPVCPPCFPHFLTTGPSGSLFPLTPPHLSPAPSPSSPHPTLSGLWRLETPSFYSVASVEFVVGWGAVPGILLDTQHCHPLCRSICHKVTCGTCRRIRWSLCAQCPLPSEDPPRSTTPDPHRACHPSLQQMVITESACLQNKPGAKSVRAALEIKFIAIPLP